jgi:dihydrofolate reductase
MRKIIYYATSSLDGYIARPDGAIDWLIDGGEEDYGYAEFFESVGTVVQGRKTYEQVLTFGDYPYSAKENFVFSRTLKQADHAEVVTMSPADFAAQQKAKPGGSIWLVGGGELVAGFFAAGVVDEMILFVQPILLGEGLSLTSQIGRDIRLTLKATQAYENGFVRLDYATS